jgi:hypothetical protein
MCPLDLIPNPTKKRRSQSKRLKDSFWNYT